MENESRSLRTYLEEVAFSTYSLVGPAAKIDRMTGDLAHLRGNLQGLEMVWQSAGPLARWFLHAPIRAHYARVRWALNILATGQALTLAEWTEVSR